MRERQEEGTTRFALQRTGLLGFLDVYIDERNRRLRAVELRIMRGDENNLSVPGEKLDCIFVPEGAQGAGEFFLSDCLQGAIE